MKPRSERTEQIAEAVDLLLELIAEDVSTRVLARLEIFASAAVDKKQAQKIVVSVKEAARMLSVSEAQIYKYIRAGELESFMFGRARRIEMSSIKAIVQRSKE